MHGENFTELERLDKEARDAGKTVGRFISEPVADGRAHYRILEVRGRQAFISVVTGLGDDWQVSFWGPEAWIDLAYAKQLLSYKDRMSDIFANKKAVGA